MLPKKGFFFKSHNYSSGTKPVFINKPLIDNELNAVPISYTHTAYEKHVMFHYYYYESHDFV